MCKFDEGNNVPKNTRTLGLKPVRWDDLHVASRPKVLSKRVNCYLITNCIVRNRILGASKESFRDVSVDRC